MDSVGVFLWANRAQYAEVSFQTVSDSDIAEIGLPTMQEDADEDGPLIPLLVSFVPNGSLRELFCALTSVLTRLLGFRRLTQ